MKALIIFFAFLVAGCTGPSAREDYYAAVAIASAAQAQEAQSKYAALSAMAATSRAGGDNSASVAAVMAIAMSQYRPIQPAYIEDAALKWAQVLVGPITTLGALSIQSSLSRDLSDNNRDLGIARIESDAATDQILYGALTAPPPDINFPDIVLPEADPSISDNALDIIVDGLVNISTTGIAGVENSTAIGYQTIEDIVANQNTTLENVTDGLQPIIVPVVNTPVFQPRQF